MVEGSPNAPQVHFGREIHFLVSVDKRFFVHVWVLWEGRGGEGRGGEGRGGEGRGGEGRGGEGRGGEMRGEER